MRVMWKGAISFGLVTIPIKMYTATEKKDIKFRNLHRECGTPLEYKKICPACNKEIDQAEIAKGYEFEQDKFVIIEEEDLERIPGEKTKTIDILDFVKLKDIDPVYFDKTYYLAPGQAGEKAYELLASSLLKSKMIAIAQVIIRSKQALAVIRVFQGILTMETMFYPDEVRKTNALPEWKKDIKVHDNEIIMAQELIKNLSGKFEPEKYQDEYREEVLKVISGKVEGKQISAPTYKEEGKVVDLMEALKASVELAKQKQGENETEVNSEKKARANK